MSKQLQLNAEKRDAKSEKPNKLRESGMLPAVVYNSGKPALSLKLKASEFGKVFTQAGETDLIELSIAGEASEKVLIHSVDRNMKDQPIHVDFYRVSMDKLVQVAVPLNFVGESKAVKELGGSLSKAVDHVEIECLPGDLIHGFDVDLSLLTAIGDHITMADLKVPQGVKLLANSDDMIASVMVAGTQSVEPAPTAEAAAPAKEEAAPAEKK
jgi:large subunit ribosomal protein L25